MPDSEVIRVMRQFKADLLAGEQKQSQEMARTWLKAERRLSSEMTALAYEMDGIKRDGGTVSREMLMTNVRYRELLNQLTDELEGYTDYAERTITDRQRQLARLGITHAESAIRAQSVSAGFNRLPVEAVQHLVGLSGDGTPLANLLTASWPLSAQRLTDELVSGVALGYNPRKVAKNMAQAAGASQQRMEVIARTEQLRVYREANRQSYKASGVVDGYRRLATHDRRVCAACLMDEGTFYALDEEMPEHPQGRCTMIPVVSGVPQPQWQQGQAWLEEQSQDVQQEILGKGRYYAWQNGDVELKDLVTVKPNATWGPSLQVTPLRDLGAKAIVPQMPIPSVESIIRRQVDVFEMEGETWDETSVFLEGGGWQIPVKIGEMSSHPQGAREATLSEKEKFLGMIDELHPNIKAAWRGENTELRLVIAEGLARHQSNFIFIDESLLGSSGKTISQHEFLHHVAGQDYIRRGLVNDYQPTKLFKHATDYANRADQFDEDLTIMLTKYKSDRAKWADEIMNDFTEGFDRNLALEKINETVQFMQRLGVRL